MRVIMQFYYVISRIFERVCLSILVLIIRFWVAEIFWHAGLAKISSWQSTIFLFKYEYKVPVIPPELAAYFATIFEISCPILLILGLAARAASLPLIAMTAVIQFTYLDNIEHYYWAMLLALILFYGPGKISVDYFIFKKISKKYLKV